jgi:carbonic anhydrase/acetyltransferase-like protein (isoleucine patch superfamily)
VPLYALGDVEPDIHPDAYVHPDAVVIGNVAIGAEASVWPSAVLRGDTGRIEIGPRSNVQDGSIIHCTEREPTIIGSEVTVGHNVHIEGATIGDRALVSSGSVVLNGAAVGEGAVVAAGAVVAPNGRVPARRMAWGVPARVREGYEVPDGMSDGPVQSYRQRAKRFRAELRRLPAGDGGA